MISRLIANLLSGVNELKHKNRALRQSKIKIKIMQYNILARDFTVHFDHLHLSTDKPVDQKRTKESEEQTSQRYSIVANEIIAQAPDVACLQEVDTHFFDTSSGSLNPNATNIVAQYNIYHENSEGGVGTAVIIRKTSSVAVCEDVGVIKIPGGSHFGGGSKSAVAVPIRWPSGMLWVVSGHLNWRPEGRLLHMQEIEKQVKGKIQACLASAVSCPTELVFSGDFNTTPEALPATIDQSFLSSSRMNMNLLAPEDITQNLTGAGNKEPPDVLPEMIDYIFGTQGVAVVEGSVVIQPTPKGDGTSSTCTPCLEHPPRYPYDVYSNETSSPSAITHGSDHSWVTVSVTL
jgi:endonuclease/exonuclease/phosphatase family metal-dependent hydrolase